MTTETVLHLYKPEPAPPSASTAAELILLGNRHRGQPTLVTDGGRPVAYFLPTDMLTSGIAVAATDVDNLVEYVRQLTHVPPDEDLGNALTRLVTCPLLPLVLAAANGLTAGYLVSLPFMMSFCELDAGGRITAWKQPVPKPTVKELRLKYSTKRLGNNEP
jgi:hypothetical protein